MYIIDELCDVEEIPFNNYDTRRSDILRKAYSEGALSWSYRNQETTYTEKCVFNTIPKDAECYHHNYLSYLQNAYAKHRKVVIAPHTFWYSIVAEIAQHVVSNADKHRSLFTKDPTEKIEIIVECFREDEPLRMGAIFDRLKELVPVNVELFVPEFSTSTEMSELATLGAFLETCSPYYSYGMLACGIPEIKVEGTLNDWTNIRNNLLELVPLFESVDSALAPHINNNILPILEKLIVGKDRDWFFKIFTQKRCGSGSQHFVDGWFTKMFMDIPKQPEVANFSSHVTKVPYFTLPSNTNWHLALMLSHSTKSEDGFLVPDFSVVQLKHLVTPEVVKHNNNTAYGELV